MLVGIGLELDCEDTDRKTKRLGYIRTSTDEQVTARQIDGLKPHCDELFIESGVSASQACRPVYDKVIQCLEPGDVLVVWDLDRAFRSTVDAVLQLETLKSQGVEFKIVSLNIDTSTPAGMLIYTILAALAQWERDTIRQRTREGIAAARARGKRIGRPPKLTAEQLDEIQSRLDAGKTTITSAAKATGVHPWTLSRALKRYLQERP